MSDEEKKDDKKDKKKPQFFSENNFNKNNGNKPNGFKKHPIALGIFIFLIVSFIFMLFNSRNSDATKVAYSDFLNSVKSGKVSTVVIKDTTSVIYTVKTGQKFTARIPYIDKDLLPKLEAANVKIIGKQADVNYLMLLLQSLPWLLFLAYMIFIWKQMKGGGGQMMGLGKSKAKKYKDTESKTTFADVAGQKEAKYELEEVVDFLKDPKKYSKIGARVPKGVLLVGPPGTGKTLLAKAVAGEAKVSFLHTSGSDFVEMFVGMGAARVRDLFSEARKQSPCIIFIDELDAVGRSRGSGLGGGHDEREQTLNQMLVEMDGFEKDSGVIVIAATNRPDVLDPALLRPGRFDRQVAVSLPDIGEREDILKIHCKNIKKADEVDLSRIARATPGSSGADLANLVNEAALYAARDSREVVKMLDFENARDKLLMGVERKSIIMSDEDKLATAYHEGGHTLLHYYLKNADPLHKVTIIPRGRALGVTMSLPEKDAYTMNKNKLLDWIKINMGGFVAEELIYGQTTTGVSNDIKVATNTARSMVREYGMSSLGFCSFGSDNEPLFLGREITQHKDFSDATALEIDKEVEKILSTCLEETRSIIKEHKDQLDLLAKTLVERETMDDVEIRELLGFEQVENKISFIDKEEK